MKPAIRQVWAANTSISIDEDIQLPFLPFYFYKLAQFLHRQS